MNVTEKYHPKAAAKNINALNTYNPCLPSPYVKEKKPGENTVKTRKLKIKYNNNEDDEDDNNDDVDRYIDR